ncbi:multiheme c-type cytochrome [Paraliomyxa miuraensis]|uniref:multiheme c-type cytochrome n=1 Tax=Paraliomyxa miuraensis TaxID=376150 RepID=UPI002255E6CD|nr:multiheme c-type cytochrome [Paraliomyxa miuraensis]MCX4239277.1 cytochrome c family protein [Paraliomyxa miuraensis]
MKLPPLHLRDRWRSLWGNRRRRWLLIGGVTLGFVVMCYVGFGRTHATWTMPLQYPRSGQDADPSAFTPAATCGACHVQHYAEWLESGMGKSSELSYFLIDLYQASLDIRGAPPDDVAQCLHCHAPLAVMGPEPDLAMARDISQEGVNCDVCHTAVEAHPNDAPGMIRWDPTGPKRGPLPGSEDATIFSGGDSGIDLGTPPAVSPFHKTARSPLHESSDLCGACHMSLWPTNALPIDWTYAEWARSPWAAEGKTCQSCHMPTYEGSAAPQAPVRKNLHRHTFPGGGDVELVRSAAQLELEAQAHYAGHEVTVRVENVGAGHAFPTGNATAPVVFLELVALGADGSEVFRDRRDYRLVYVDADGDVTSDPSVAVRMLSDTTLQPREPRHERFFLAHRLGATRVEARLVYQRWSDDVVNNHAGLVREFVGRYLQQGFRVHRLIANLDKLDPSKIARVRGMEAVEVDAATAELPPPPALPPGWSN